MVPALCVVKLMRCDRYKGASNGKSLKLMNDQTYTNRKDTSYICPTARVAITLVAMVLPDGSSSTNFMTEKQGWSR